MVCLHIERTPKLMFIITFFPKGFNPSIGVQFIGIKLSSKIHHTRMTFFPCKMKSLIDLNKQHRIFMMTHFETRGHFLLFLFPFGDFFCLLPADSASGMTPPLVSSFLRCWPPCTRPLLSCLGGVVQWTPNCCPWLQFLPLQSHVCKAQSWLYRLESEKIWLVSLS